MSTKPVSLEGDMMSSIENPTSLPKTAAQGQGEAAGEAQSNKREIDQTELDSGTEQPVKRIKGKQNRSGKTRGGNFSVEEVSFLLSNLEELLPLGGFEWEHVLELHEKKYPNEGRTADGLRRKFHALANGKGPGGPADGPDYFAQAKTLRSRLADRPETTHVDVEKASTTNDNESDDEEGANTSDSVAESSQKLATQSPRKPESPKYPTADRRLELDLKIQLSKLEVERMKIEREGRKDFLDWTTQQMERHHQLMLAMLNQKTPTHEEVQTSSEK